MAVDVVDTLLALLILQDACEDIIEMPSQYASLPFEGLAAVAACIFAGHLLDSSGAGG